MLNNTEIFTVKNIIIYMLIVNLLAFIIMFIDKRKAIKNEWRISEKFLIIIAIIGGSVGELIGMYVFHHKTKKLKFSIGVPVIIIAQIILIIYILSNKIIIL